MKRIILVMVLILASFAVWAAGNSEPEGAVEYKFAVVGPGVHPFYALFPKALEDVAKDFDLPEIKLQFPQDFNQTQQNVILDGLVAKGYNGIAIQPSDSVAANQKISELMEMGIAMSGFGAAPEQPTDLPFVVSTDVTTAAYNGAKILFESMNGKGNVVHLTGGLADANTKKRMDAVEKAAGEFSGIELIQTITDIDVAELAQNAVDNLMAAKRDSIDGIICTAYNPTVAIASVFTQLNEKRIKVVGIDTDKSVLQAISDGYITGTMAQNPYSMAYIPVYALKLFADGYSYKASSPFNVDSGTFFVSESDLETVDKKLADVTKSLLENFKSYFEAN